MLSVLPVPFYLLGLGVSCVGGSFFQLLSIITTIKSTASGSGSHLQDRTDYKHYTGCPGSVVFIVNLPLVEIERHNRKHFDLQKLTNFINWTNLLNNIIISIQSFTNYVSYKAVSNSTLCVLALFRNSVF